MKKSRFSEEKMVAILREAERSSVPETAKKHGVSEPTVYAWRKRFGGMDANDTKRQLEAENARLKKLLAERGPVLGRLWPIAARPAGVHRLRGQSSAGGVESAACSGRLLCPKALSPMLHRPSLPLQELGDPVGAALTYL
ncbi:transposase [Myxococcus sp. CA051A]|nr:transposase [Myxococcus sp. CA051A]